LKAFTEITEGQKMKAASVLARILMIFGMKSVKEILIFEVDKFLQTLLILDQLQRRLAVTRQTEGRNLV
jgi:hypothetical protein